MGERQARTSGRWQRPSTVGRAFATGRASLLTSNRVGLGNVKDNSGVADSPGRYLLFTGRLVALFALRRNPGRYLDAMLPAADLAPKRPPSVIGEDILARKNVRLWDSFLHESLEDRCIVHRRLVANRPT